MERVLFGFFVLAAAVLAGERAAGFAALEVETRPTQASPAPSGTLQPELHPSHSLTVTQIATRTAEPSPTYSATPSEPAGCLEPPDDYTRIDLPYSNLNMRTYSMLQQATVLYEGEIDILEAITQGSYTDAEAASFGTHAGGGVVDLSVIRMQDWTILWDEIEPLIRALRTAGFAAWLRQPDALYPGSPIHIHAVAVGDTELSYAAQLQVYSDYGYLAGMDGLPPAAGQEPSPDLHGGLGSGQPLVCEWMRE